MNATKRAKPKSPPIPSRSLVECIADVKKLYAQYSHATFSRGEIASTLNVSATSGPFGGRLFSLKEFGLIDASGGDYKVSEAFMTLNSNAQGSGAYKSAALAALRRSDTFRELLDEFRSKLPSVEGVAQRLETQKKFNSERAKLAAAVLEESMRHAALIDANNNVLPVRDTPGSTPPNDNENKNQNNGGGDQNEPPVLPDPPSVDHLHVEIPVGEDRKVVIYYPRDLVADEAQKVGNVLKAIVS
jgi:hypothetical protein